MPTDKTQRKMAEKKSLCDRIRSLFSQDKERVQGLEADNSRLADANRQLEKVNHKQKLEIVDLKAQLADVEKLVKSLENGVSKS